MVFTGVVEKVAPFFDDADRLGDDVRAAETRDDAGSVNCVARCCSLDEDSPTLLSKEVDETPSFAEEVWKIGSTAVGDAGDSSSGIELVFDSENRFV